MTARPTVVARGLPFQHDASRLIARKLGTARLPWAHFQLIFKLMTRNSHIRKSIAGLPCVQATGRVESRLPGRKRICPECGGTGKVSTLRREALLKKMKSERA
jgi:hypothetical protein